MTEELFTPFTAGKLELRNRVVMAPLTRNRADNDTSEVGQMQVDYYRQRAGAGLIITEATQISPMGKGYVATPGIHSDGQVAAWKKVTDAVHEAGGTIAIQLWHVGRISHTSLLPEGEVPVAPSAIGAEAPTFTTEGPATTSEPRALTLEEIPGIVEEYRHAAKAAKAAGFDAIELHAANGYLLDQFLKDGTNTREDAYGGSVENRARLLFEVMDALLEVWEPGRVGIRLSPCSDANNAHDSDPLGHFAPVVERLNGYGLAYLHMVEGQTGGDREGAYDKLMALWTGPKMGNNGYDRDLAIERVAKGEVDLVAFGRPYIANPDLAERLEAGVALNEGDQDTWYGGGREGYTDYPTRDADKAA